MAEPFSGLQKLRLVFRLCLAPIRVLAYVTRSAVIAWARKLPVGTYIVCAIAKALQDAFDAHDTQYVCAPTREIYERWISEKISQEAKNEHSEIVGRLCCDIQPLDDGKSSILWVGNRKKAKKVVLFFHGGGYTTPMLTGYMEWIWRAFIMVGVETQTEVAVAILQYTLSPGAQYPTQLCQAASALAFLLASGVSPENLIVGGDSAGGNLTGQLLCHLACPHPEAAPISLAKPLSGVFLVSPWLTKDTNDQSFAENGAIDMLSASFVNLVMDEVLGSDWSERDNGSLSHAFLLDMEQPWMDKLGTITERIYMTVGYHEVFRDQCIKFAELLKKNSPRLKLRFDLQEKMAHDFILLEGEGKRNGECMGAMKEWVTNVVSADCRK